MILIGLKQQNKCSEIGLENQLELMLILGLMEQIKYLQSLQLVATLYLVQLIVLWHLSIHM